MELIAADESEYSIKDLLIFAMITIVATNLATIFSEISIVVLTASYLILEFVGIVLFVYVLYKTLTSIKSSIDENKN